MARDRGSQRTVPLTSCAPSHAPRRHATGPERAELLAESFIYIMYMGNNQHTRSSTRHIFLAYTIAMQVRFSYGRESDPTASAIICRSSPNPSSPIRRSASRHSRQPLANSFTLIHTF